MLQRRIAALVACLLAAILASVSPTGAQTVQRVSLANNHIVYDAKSNRFYVSVPSTSADHADTVTSLDPTTGNLDKNITTGAYPDALALSDDGQFLYVSFDATQTVRRVPLTAQGTAVTFSLGSYKTLGPFYAERLAVMPGHPRTVAVSRRLYNYNQNQGVVLYDGSVPRPHSITGDQARCNGLAFVSESTLYAQNGDDSDYGFSRITVDAKGLNLVDHVAGLLTGFYSGIRYDPFDGLVYGSGGQTADPLKGQLRSRFVLPPDIYNSFSRIYDVLPDAAHGSVYMLVGDISTNDVTIAVFDAQTFLAKGALGFLHALPSDWNIQSSMGDLTFWGSDGLAFRTTNDVFLIRGRQFPGLASFTLDKRNVQDGALVTGTITLTQPAPADGVTVDLDKGANNFQVTVPAGQSQISFPFRSLGSGYELAVAARYGAQQIKQPLAVLDRAATPIYPPNVLVTTLDNNGLVYDKYRNTLFTSVPSRAGKLGNQVAQILPANGAIINSAWAGSEPSRLALSDDGKILYTALDGAAAIQPLTLPYYQPLPAFTVGRDPFYGPDFIRQIVALPGQPQAVAVSRYHPGYSPSFAGVVVFDSGVPRPNAFTDFTGGEVIAAGADATRLYGYDNETTGAELVRMALDANGITVLSTTPNLLGGIGASLKFAQGKLFAFSGYVIDAETANVIGRYQAAGEVVPDLEHNRVYYLNNYNQWSVTVSGFVADTYERLFSVTIPTRDYASDFTLAGVNRVAFRTSDQVFLVDLNPASLKAFLPWRSTVKGGTNARGVIVLSNYAPIGGAQVTFTSSNPDVLPVPDPIVLPEGGFQTNFAFVTNPVTTNTPVTLTATYGGVTKAIPLTITP